MSNKRHTQSFQESCATSMCLCLHITTVAWLCCFTWRTAEPQRSLQSYRLISRSSARSLQAISFHLDIGDRPPVPSSCDVVVCIVPCYGLVLHYLLFEAILLESSWLCDFVLNMSQCGNSDFEEKDTLPTHRTTCCLLLMLTYRSGRLILPSNRNEDQFSKSLYMRPL